MESRQTRMIVAAACGAAAVGVVVWLVWGGGPPAGDGSARVEAGAGAEAQVSANANAIAGEDAGAEAEAGALALADAGDGDAGAGASASAKATASARATASASAGATASAAPSTSTSTSTNESGKAVSLDESSDGKTIELGVGQSVVLMLGASPTSGFDWSVTKAPAALGAPVMGYIAPPGDAMGAPGKRRITWTVKSALPAGDQAVELAYRRGFEQGVPALKTFRFKVRAAH